uniref:ADP-ribosyl cyclase/cyclic ADP-ribose hydrolase n=1 Tax=Picea sitchensis TaxID=3332 RepID=D5AAU4_PICSI|nr:unknown [Picea sitchensis]
MAAASSSTTASLPNIYTDVFINHCGPDVTRTFASHLYRRRLSHRLRVSLEEDELQAGENIVSQRVDANRTASVHIAIFSETCAESSCCLYELRFMVESGSTIIPVFYGVKTAELRWGQKDQCMLKPYTNLRRRLRRTLKLMKRGCDTAPSLLKVGERFFLVLQR